MEVAEAEGKQMKEENPYRGTTQALKARKKALKRELREVDQELGNQPKKPSWLSRLWQWLRRPFARCQTPISAGGSITISAGGSITFNNGRKIIDVDYAIGPDHAVTTIFKLDDNSELVFEGFCRVPNGQTITRPALEFEARRTAISKLHHTVR